MRRVVSRAIRDPLLLSRYPLPSKRNVSSAPGGTTVPRKRVPTAPLEAHNAFVVELTEKETPPFSPTVPYRPTSTPMWSSNFAEMSAEEVFTIEKQQVELFNVPMDDLIERILLYLRATQNKTLVSAKEEHILFPVLFKRIKEAHVNQLLDVVDSHWARSTLLRYGIQLNDVVRDRIAFLASSLSDHDSPDESSSVASKEEEQTSLYKDQGGGDEKEEEDYVLTNAATELDPNTVWRTIYVMGVFGGHRKRDVEFFELLGFYLMQNLSTYDDPNQLVAVLTAFNRAKVKPSPRFLHQLSRRLSVLHKTTPLEPLPSYRAITNFNRAGYQEMDVYRFLSDCIVSHIEQELQKEKEALKGFTVNPAAQLDGEYQKARLYKITGLSKVSMFTKWLNILSKWGAPHQIYFRPFISPLILPILPHLPPPSFTRLLDTIQRHRSNDLEIMEPIMEHLLHLNRTTRTVSRVDLILVLSILSEDDAAVPSSLSPFMELCRQVLSLSSLDVLPEVLTSKRRVPQLVRPTDMCVIVSCLGRLQKNTEIELETLDPLVTLSYYFAEHLLQLLRIGVVSLSYVDRFIAVSCEAMLPDPQHTLRALEEARRLIDDEEEYYSRLDVDVRQLLFEIVTVNGAHTYFNYRPLPGPLQVDFRESLARASFLDLMESIHLYESTNPNSLQFETGLLLSRSVLAKVSGSGEEVLDEDGKTLVLRKSKDIILTQEDLKRVVQQVKECSIASIRQSYEMWNFMLKKAKNLGMSELVSEAETRLAELKPSP